MEQFPALPRLNWELDNKVSPARLSMRLPLRFSLRALLLVTLFAGVLLGFAARVHSRGSRQRQVLVAAAKAGGHVRYDFECYSESPYYAVQRGLAPRIGPDLVGNVLILNFDSSSPRRWRTSLPQVTELQSIQYFSACGSGLEPEDIEHLSRLQQLKELHLQYSQDLPDLRPLANLSHLELLGVNSCRGVTAAKLQAFRSLPRLKKIDLCCSDATDEIVPLLAKFPALEEIHVEASNITAAGLVQLKSSKSLRVIHLDASQAQAEITQQLPGLRWEVK